MTFIDSAQILQDELKERLSIELPRTIGSGLQFINLLKEFVERLDNSHEIRFQGMLNENSVNKLTSIRKQREKQISAIFWTIITITICSICLKIFMF